MRAVIPMVLGAIPFGLIYGAIAVQAGLSAAAAIGMSLFVFAGSSQFIGATLYGQGAAPVLISFTTFIVNARHALYSASLAPYLGHLPRAAVPAVVYADDVVRGDDRPVRREGGRSRTATGSCWARTCSCT